jgi:phosphate transport system substrate-binding protein
MIKLSILIVALSLPQLTTAEFLRAASPSETAPIRQQGEPQASNPTPLQTATLSGDDTSSSWPVYQPADGPLAGEFRLAFETETEQLAESSLSDFSEYYPQLNSRAYNIQLDTFGTWWESPHTMGLLQLQMTEREQAAFERKHGHPPTVLPVAMTAVAIVVHPDNPIVNRGLSLAELDAIFSETRDRGHAEVSLWGDLGLGGQWALRPIYKYRVTEVNPLNDFFQRYVLQGGQFKTVATRESTSDEVIDRIGGYEQVGAAVASEGDRDAIGFAYLDEVTDTVAKVPVSAGNDQAAAFPTAENIREMRYPLLQHTYLYLNVPPDGNLEGAQLEFVEFIFSQQGQQILQELNYTPAPRAAVVEKLRAIGVRVE